MKYVPTTYAQNEDLFSMNLSLSINNHDKSFLKYFANFSLYQVLSKCSELLNFGIIIGWFNPPDATQLLVFLFADHNIDSIFISFGKKSSWYFNWKKKSIDLCYFFTGKFKDLGVINFSTVSSVTFLRASWWAVQIGVRISINSFFRYPVKSSPLV